MNLLRPVDRFVTVNGLRFHALDWGGEGRTPLLLLHGFTGHAHAWDTLAIALQPDFHVYALDQRGHARVAQGGQRSLRRGKEGGNREAYGQRHPLPGRDHGAAAILTRRRAGSSKAISSDSSRQPRPSRAAQSVLFPEPGGPARMAARPDFSTTAEWKIRN